MFRSVFLHVISNVITLGAGHWLVQIHNGVSECIYEIQLRKLKVVNKHPEKDFFRGGGSWDLT